MLGLGPRNNFADQIEFVQRRSFAPSDRTVVQSLATTLLPAGSRDVAPIDVAFVGIGENGRLALCDPPADFDTSKLYLFVELDEECRQQQVNEGWFAQISEVPQKVISMSVRQMMSAREIVVVVPDGRKAQAIKLCIEGPVSPSAPASILQTHPNATIFLDRDSASLLKPEVLASL